MNSIVEKDDTAPHVAEAKPSTLNRRIVSAAVLVPGILILIYLGGWPFCILVAVSSVLMVLEWDSLTTVSAGESHHGPKYMQAVALAASILIAGTGSIAWALAALALMALALAFVAPFLGRSQKWLLLGMLWIGLPSMALVWLRITAGSGFELVLGLFLVIWACDTGAYFVGRAVGGPRLAPRWSPNKTWAGLFGGALASAVVALVWAIWTGLAPVVPAAFAGAVLAVIAQLGDLSESAVKRRFKVKDSGNLIPGHGGLLDRVDGLLFMAPVAALLAFLGGRGLA